MTLHAVKCLRGKLSRKIGWAARRGLKTKWLSEGGASNKSRVCLFNRQKEAENCSASLWLPTMVTWVPNPPKETFQLLWLNTYTAQFVKKKDYIRMLNKAFPKLMVVFDFGHMARGILGPQPGAESATCALKVQSELLNHQGFQSSWCLIFQVILKGEIKWRLVLSWSNIIPEWSQASVLLRNCLSMF